MYYHSLRVVKSGLSRHLSTNIIYWHSTSFFYMWGFYHCCRYRELYLCVWWSSILFSTDLLRTELWFPL